MKSINHPITHQIVSWIVTLLVPLVILFTVLRLVMSPIFLAVEYRMPNFPIDSYGMTQDQRLAYAPLAMEYLFNRDGIEFLSDQTFDDGSPLYNERELNHMVDVKVLVQKGLQVYIAVIALLSVIAVFAFRNDWRHQFLLMISSGGKFMIALISGLLIFIGINFNKLFTEFHHLFFKGDTWLFLFSDTLIRLFPMNFWRDAFVIVGLLSVGISFVIVKWVGK